MYIYSYGIIFDEPDMRKEIYTHNIQIAASINKKYVEKISIEDTPYGRYKVIRFNRQTNIKGVNLSNAIKRYYYKSLSYRNIIEVMPKTWRHSIDDYIEWYIEGYERFHNGYEYMKIYRKLFSMSGTIIDDSFEIVSKISTSDSIDIDLILNIINKKIKRYQNKDYTIIGIEKYMEWYNNRKENHHEYNK